MSEDTQIQEWLKAMKLSWMLEHYQDILKQSITKKVSYRECFAELLRGESRARHNNGVQRRIKAARFPVIKSFDNFNWLWPKEIDRALIEHLKDLSFVKDASNVVFVGPVGVGKTHLASALGLRACQQGYKVLFCNAVEAVNALSSANKQGRLKEQIKKYASPQILILDELGYLPIDKMGANLLFQIISTRYERGSTIITTNKAFQDWTDIFNNDSAITSAVLDRVLHYCDTILIQAASFRMKDN